MEDYVALGSKECNEDTQNYNPGAYLGAFATHQSRLLRVRDRKERGVYTDHRQ
jgi:hypothetical protein